MKNITNTAISGSLFFAMISTNPEQERIANKLLEIDLGRTVLLSKKQCEYFARKIPGTLSPKTFKNNNQVFCSSSDWASGPYIMTTLPGDCIPVGGFNAPELNKHCN